MCFCLRFDATTDDIDGPGRADQSIDQGILENRRFYCLQSFIRFDRGQDGLPQVLINLGRVDGSADKSVIEHIAYIRWVNAVALYGAGNPVLRDSLGRMGLASISVIKAAKKPMV